MRGATFTVVRYENGGAPLIRAEYRGAVRTMTIPEAREILRATPEAFGTDTHTALSDAVAQAAAATR